MSTAPSPVSGRRPIRYDNVLEVTARILITGLIVFLYLPLVPL